jgi:hypothetical protein
VPYATPIFSFALSNKFKWPRRASLYTEIGRPFVLDLTPS